MAGVKLTPMAAAFAEVGLRFSAYDHRRTLARKQTVQSYLASFVCGVPPEFRRLIAVAKLKVR